MKTVLVLCALASLPSLTYAESTAPVQPRYPLLSLPDLASFGDRSLLPSAKMVATPDGRSILVVSFKCPTEVIGVSPPMVQLVHNLVDAAMNKANEEHVLPFDMQQVCN